MACVLLLTTCLAGCGTTRFTDTRRSATEQLLVSGAIDRAVDAIDCSPLADKKVHLDMACKAPSDDQQYLIGTIRQKLLASGCVLQDKKTDADLVIEARVGAVGTDSNQVIFGVPATQVPQELAALSSSPLSVPSIPEIPIVKKQAQRGVAKVGLFAYDRKTGEAYWQSGASPVDATASEIWVIGAGPWQWGTIYDIPKFAGGDLPLAKLFRNMRRKNKVVDDPISVADIANFHAPPTDLPIDEQTGKVQLAGHTEPAKSDDSENPPPAAEAKPATLPKSTDQEAKPIPSAKTGPAEKQTAEPAKKDQAEPAKKDMTKPAKAAPPAKPPSKSD